MNLNKFFYNRYLKALAQEKKPGDTVIFFFPDYMANNPHQRLIGNFMPGNHTYIPGSINNVLFFQKHVENRVKIVFHLHWPDPILNTRNFDKFLKSVKLFKSLGGKCIWTIHNLLPHDLVLTKMHEMHHKIAALMDKLHFFTESTLTEAQNIYKIPKEKCFTVMRGNYIQSYENNVNKEESRKILNISKNKKVICFLGHLKPYKNLENLLGAFSLLNSKNNDLALLIAGKLSLKNRFIMRKTIKGAKKQANIILFSKFIPDDYIQYYLNASDILVLPYRNITNSGALILGLSFGCCIVTPDSGAITDIVKHGVNAIVYDPNDKNGLKNSLEYALSLSDNERILMGKNAYELAKTFNWENTTNKICSVIGDLFHNVRSL